MWDILYADHYTDITIDLEKETVAAKGMNFALSINPIVKQRYISNLNEIEESMALLQLIKDYEMESGI